MLFVELNKGFLEAGHAVTKPVGLCHGNLLGRRNCITAAKRVIQLLLDRNAKLCQTTQLLVAQR